MMNPTLADQIVLNTSINATLFQSPQPWWANNTISTFVTAIVTILAVYLGQRWAKKTEIEREFRGASNRAFYEYVNAFSDAGKIKEWTPALISEKLPTLWKAATEAEKYYSGPSFSLNFYINDILHVEDKEDPNISTYLEGYLEMRAEECEIKEVIEFETKRKRIIVNSLIGFVELLEALFIIQPKFIKMGELIFGGQQYFHYLRKNLLKDRPRAPSWQLWK